MSDFISCPHCGSANAPGTVECRYCGLKIKTAEKSKRTTRTVEVNNELQSSVYEPNVCEINKLMIDVNRIARIHPRDKRGAINYLMQVARIDRNRASMLINPIYADYKDELSRITVQEINEEIKQIEREKIERALSIYKGCFLGIFKALCWLLFLPIILTKKFYDKGVSTWYYFLMIPVYFIYIFGWAIIIIAITSN